MIIDGTLYFNLRVESYSDFIEPADLIAFSMKENCGAAGVVFEISFMTQDEKISNLFIENNEVVIELGESADKATTYKAFISEHPSKDQSADNGKYTVSFVATMINLAFFTTRSSEMIFGTSLDVIKQMAQTYLGTSVDAQIDTPSETEHNWLRSYETGAITMLEAWLHMHVPNTTPLLWIDTKNTVHIKDIESGGAVKGDIDGKTAIFQCSTEPSVSLGIGIPEQTYELGRIAVIIAHERAHRLSCHISSGHYPLPESLPVAVLTVASAASGIAARNATDP